MKLDWNPRSSKVLDTKEVKSTWELLCLGEEIDLGHISTIINLRTLFSNLCQVLFQLELVICFL